MKRKTPRSWTDEEIFADAMKYKTVAEWSKHSPNARVIAVRRGIYEKAAKHLTRKIKESGHWSKENIFAEAKKYDSRLRFSQGNSRAYQLALELGIIDAACKHMEPVERRADLTRCVYEISFSDGSIYIGLTLNPEIRLLEHLSQSNGSVIDRSKLLNGERPKFRILAKGLGMTAAKTMESTLIEDYRSRGIEVLNRHRGGALGSRMKYSDRELAAIAKKYLYRAEFAEKNNGAYGAARARGILTKICDHMPTPKRWTIETAFAEAKKYRTRNDWWKGSPGSYRFIEQQGLLDSAMPKINKNWTLEQALQESKKYKSRKEWQRKGGYTYQLVRDAGLLDSVMPSYDLDRGNST